MTRTTIGKLALLFAMVGALALAGCGGGDDGGLSATDQARITAAEEAAATAQAEADAAKAAADAAAAEAEAAQMEAETADPAIEALTAAVDRLAAAEAARQAAANQAEMDAQATDEQAAAEMAAAAAEAAARQDIVDIVTAVLEEAGLKQTQAEMDAEAAEMAAAAAEAAESKRLVEAIMAVLEAQGLTDLAEMGAAPSAAAVAMMVKHDQIRAHTINRIVRYAEFNAANDDISGGPDYWHIEYPLIDMLKALADRHDGSAASIKAATAYKTALEGMRVQLRRQITNSLAAGESARDIVMALFDAHEPGTYDIDIALAAALEGPPGPQPNPSDVVVESNTNVIHNYINNKIAAMSFGSVAELADAIRAELTRFGATTLPGTDEALEGEILAQLGDGALNTVNVRSVVTAMLASHPVAITDNNVAMARMTTPSTEQTESMTTGTEDPMGTFASVLGAAHSNLANVLLAGDTPLNVDARTYDGDLATMQGSVQTVNGIKTANFRYAHRFGGLTFADTGDTVDGWGGWIEHAAFGVLLDDETMPGSSAVKSFSLGSQVTPQAKIGEATWNGAMRGYWTDDDPGDPGDTGNMSGFVTGAVEIKVDIDDNDKTATVKIEDLMKGSVEVADDLMPGVGSWEDIPINDGVFGTIATHNLHGSFYGPNGEEAGGVIDVDIATGTNVADMLANGDNITGSFGAKK